MNAKSDAHTPSTLDASPVQKMALLRRHPIWQDAADVTLRALSAQARVLALAPGDLAVREGQTAREVFLLCSGSLRVFYPKLKSRPEVTVKLLRAPACFGDIAALNRVVYMSNVEALEASTVVGLETRVFVDALQREPRALFRQYFDIAQRFLGAVESERAGVSASIAERVAALLLAYARQFGTEVEGGVLIDTALGQDEIARQVGSNRRSVVRVLADLYAAGAVKRKGHRYIVCGRERLIEAVQAPVADLLAQTSAQPWAELKRP